MTKLTLLLKNNFILDFANFPLSNISLYIESVRYTFVGHNNIIADRALNKARALLLTTRTHQSYTTTTMWHENPAYYFYLPTAKIEQGNITNFL